MRLILMLIACGGGVTAGKSDPVDSDGDGFPSDMDCDDLNDAAFPGAEEACNGFDDDCDGLVDADDDDLQGPVPLYADDDGDGYGDPDRVVTVCDGGVEDDGDCDDTRAGVNPGTTETCDTLYDDDCDGDDNDEGATGCTTLYADGDGDGYGGETSACVCLPDEDWPAYYAHDCDDADATVHPDAGETCDDGIDNDCDGEAIGCTWAGDTSLSESDARVFGTPGLGLGEEVRALGDLDRDGKDDFAALGAGGTGGAVGFFLGTPAGELTLDDASGLLEGTADSPLTAVSDRADLDGDGVDDLLVGSLNAGAGAGAVYLWSAPEGFSGELTDLVSLVGDGEGQAGLPAAAGDLNDDGFADLAVSAVWDEDVWLVRGPLTASAALSDRGKPVRGATNGATAMAAIGDTNGDGLSDLAIGGPGAGTGGEVWVLLGPATVASSMGSADGTLSGTEADGELGASVAAAGDHDGDGYDDLLAGAPEADLDGRSKGLAWLVLGPVTGSIGPDTVFYGEYTDDRAGASVAGEGDADGDGALDVAIGAWGNDQVATSAGLTYLVYGAVTAGTYELKYASAFFEAREYKEYSGTSVAIGSDLDADGIDDVIIGSPGYDGGGSDAGSVEILLGRGM